MAAGVDRICAEDKAWFESHPDQWTRTRPIGRAERQMLEHLDVGAAEHVHIIAQPWGRLRQFCSGDRFVSVALDPDDEAAS